MNTVKGAALRQAPPSGFYQIIKKKWLVRPFTGPQRAEAGSRWIGEVESSDASNGGESDVGKQPLLLSIPSTALLGISTLILLWPFVNNPPSHPHSTRVHRHAHTHTHTHTRPGTHRQTHAHAFGIHAHSICEQMHYTTLHTNTHVDASTHVHTQSAHNHIHTHLHTVYTYIRYKV